MPSQIMETASKPMPRFSSRAASGPAPSALPTLTLPALATGGLLWLCHFPVAWGWLGWIALVPFLSLARSSAKARWIYLSAWAGGLAFFVPALQWMRVADERMVYTWLGLALFCSLFFPLALFLIRRIERGTPLPLVVSVPIVWTALEFLRGNIMGGFPWYFLAHTQHDFLTIIQISDLTGAYGVTFLVAAVNALLFEALYRLAPLRRLLNLEKTRIRASVLGQSVQVLCVALLVAGVVVYGQFRLQQTPFSKGPRLAIVQCDIEQGVRNATISPSEAERKKAGETMSQQYANLSLLAARQHADLIVWPETSSVHGWADVAKGFPALNRGLAEQTVAEQNAPLLEEARSSQTNVLFGLIAYTFVNEKESRRHNTAIMVDANGLYVAQYDKMHRVPFGEYMPLADTLPWLKVFSPYGDAEYSVTAGERFTRFPVGDHKFGVVICFEDSDPDLGRQYAGGDSGPPADFLVNISNDGWFKGTSEHEEHLAISRFRAVECRRSLVRSVNMGISAVIDGNGRVLAPASASEESASYTWSVDADNGHAAELPVSRWSEFKKVKGVLIASIPIDHRSGWYARCGDWLPWTCWLGVAGLLVFGFVRRPNRGEALSA
jgi:apolipoprotein N-acyltransferase